MSSGVYCGASVLTGIAFESVFCVDRYFVSMDAHSGKSPAPGGEESHSFSSYHPRSLPAVSAAASFRPCLGRRLGGFGKRTSRCCVVKRLKSTESGQELLRVFESQP